MALGDARDDPRLWPPRPPGRGSPRLNDARVQQAQLPEVPAAAGRARGRRRSAPRPSRAPSGAVRGRARSAHPPDPGPCLALGERLKLQARAHDRLQRPGEMEHVMVALWRSATAFSVRPSLSSASRTSAMASPKLHGSSELTSAAVPPRVGAAVGPRGAEAVLVGAGANCPPASSSSVDRKAADRGRARRTPPGACASVGSRRGLRRRHVCDGHPERLAAPS